MVPVLIRGSAAGRARRTLLALVLILALPLGGPAGAAKSADFSWLQGLGRTHYHRLESEALGRPLHIYVRAPDAPEDPAKPLPTVYLLDGGLTFPLLSAYYHYLRIGEELPELILVGISYGSDRFEGGNYRSSDFTAPADDREWWGGAPRFQAMLDGELLPWVESHFPADPGRRILFGQSLGGQFVLYSALTRPALFWGHLASNPALHRNVDFFLSWRGAGEAPRAATRLFVSVGELDDTRFREPAARWIGHWSAQPAAPFILETRTLPAQTHLSAAPEAFRQGLEWLFARPD